MRNYYIAAVELSPTGSQLQHAGEPQPSLARSINRRAAASPASLRAVCTRARAGSPVRLPEARAVPSSVAPACSPPNSSPSRERSRDGGACRLPRRTDGPCCGPAPFRARNAGVARVRARARRRLGAGGAGAGRPRCSARRSAAVAPASGHRSVARRRRRARGAVQARQGQRAVAQRHLHPRRLRRLHRAAGAPRRAVHFSAHTGRGRRAAAAPLPAAASRPRAAASHPHTVRGATRRHRAPACAAPR